MSLSDLPPDVSFRVEFFDQAGAAWETVSRQMDTTYFGLLFGPHLPEFSERIPENLRSFGAAANKAFDAYLGALQEGARSASSVAVTLQASGRSYLRAEGYNEDIIEEIERELADG